MFYSHFLVTNPCESGRMTVNKGLWHFPESKIVLANALAKWYIIDKGKAPTPKWMLPIKGLSS